MFHQTSSTQPTRAVLIPSPNDGINSSIGPEGWEKWWAYKKEWDKLQAENEADRKASHAEYEAESKARQAKMQAEFEKMLKAANRECCREDHH